MKSLKIATNEKCETSKNKKHKKTKDRSLDVPISKHKDISATNDKYLKKKKKKRKNSFEVADNNITENGKKNDGNLKRKYSEIDPEPYEENTVTNKLDKKKKKKLKKSGITSHDKTDLDSSSVQQEKPSGKKKNALCSKYKQTICDKGFSSEETPTMTKKERNLYKPKNEYKPGTLSDVLQIKKFGSLAVPWDPSFGLDPSYKKLIKEENGQKPQLKINPLYDLSKRNNDNSAPSVDKMQCKLFIGNLPGGTNYIDVKKLFRKFGHIDHVKLYTKKSKNSKKITHTENDVVEPRTIVNAKVSFKTVESCTAALKMNGKLYKDHHLRVTLAQCEDLSEANKSVFVGNVPFTATDDDLWKVFEDCGKIMSVRIIRDDQTGKSKGFGYVNFQGEDSIEAALKLDGTPMLDRNIRVSRCKSNATSRSNLSTVKRKGKKKKKKYTPESTDECVNDLSVPKKTKKVIQESDDIQIHNTELPLKNKIKKKRKSKKKIPRQTTE